MRWTKRPDKIWDIEMYEGEPLYNGRTRVKTRFLIIPRHLDSGRWRWLEEAMVIEKYSGLTGRWHIINFANQGENGSYQIIVQSEMEKRNYFKSRAR